MRWRWPLLALVATGLTISTARAQSPSRPGETPAKDAKPVNGESPAKDAKPTKDNKPTKDAKPASGEKPEQSNTDASNTQTCLTHFSDAQRLRREGALLASRQALTVCAQPDCPDAIANKCVGWLQEVRAAIPSILVAAQDGSGSDLANVTVIIDGKRVRERLDGRPIELDPGLRKLRFEHPPDAPKQLDLLIVATEKNRRVELIFAPPKTPSPQPSSDPLPSLAPANLPDESLLHGAIAAYALGGAGLIAGSVLGGLALDQAATLRSVCGADPCTEQQRDSFDEGAALAHGATASFVVAGLGAALGTTLLVLHITGNAADKTEDTDAPLQMGLGPGGVTLRGAF